MNQDWTTATIMSSTCTSTNHVWDTWITNVTNGTASTATTVWTNWNTSSTITLAGAYRPRTREERARDAEREANYRREEAARQRELNARIAAERRIAEEAEKRAEELLLAILNPEQRATYQNSKFVVITGRSGRRYRVRRGRVGNVDVVDRQGFIESRLCAHPGIWTPDHDVMTAQLLHLQNDEEGFIRTANVHPPYQAGERVLQPLLH